MKMMFVSNFNELSLIYENNTIFKNMLHIQFHS